MKKWMTSITVFILSFALTLFVGFYSFIFFIGPHSGILPQYLFIPVGLLLILLVVGISVWLAKKTYLRIVRNENKSKPE